MEWTRGSIVGRGTFATVNLAAATLPGDHPQFIMAVKSAALNHSDSLQKEKQILSHLRPCPQIVACFGDDLTAESGIPLYNLFLEYVAGGTLADHLRRSGGRLPECEVRLLARSILLGLRFVHASGYVHCDVKLQNLLLSSPEDVKIADFGLAKKTGERSGELRGTPLYMSPESVARGECEAPADIWSLGCAVSEMIRGKSAWECSPETDVAGLLFRIGFGSETPEIPCEMSEDGRDFLSKCFVRDPAKRWTAEMLLEHPFVDLKDETTTEAPKKLFGSPRSAFDFPEWNASNSTCSSPLHSLNYDAKAEILQADGICNLSHADRIALLATAQKPSWSDEGWITLREADPIDPQFEETGVPKKMMTEERNRAGISWEFDPTSSLSCETFESISSPNPTDGGVWSNSNLFGSLPNMGFTEEVARGFEEFESNSSKSWSSNYSALCMHSCLITEEYKIQIRCSY